MKLFKNDMVKCICNPRGISALSVGGIYKIAFVNYDYEHIAIVNDRGKLEEYPNYLFRKLPNNT